jgi:hypothetical protein
MNTGINEGCMSLTNGHYYGVSIETEECEYELDVEVNEDNNHIDGKRTLCSDQQPEAPDDSIEGQIKDGIDKIKKGGWKTALSLAKKAATDYLQDEKKSRSEKPDAHYKDPMNPEYAFELTSSDKVTYSPIPLLADKEKNTDVYQYRCGNSYGVLLRKSDDVICDVSFTYPSHEYASKHYPEQHVGHSVPDWRREDDVLHKMRIHYLSKDKSKAEAAAKSADFDKEKEAYYSVDLSSTRSNEKTRFSFPDLNLDEITCSIGMSFIHGWYLPTKTKLGRQIQYNWDALRVSVTQSNNIISRKVCMISTRGRELINSMNNQFELMDGGYLAEVTEGHYELQVGIYKNEMLTYPFEVIRVDSTDTRSKDQTYYVLKTPEDDYAKIKYCQDSFQLDFRYPLSHLAREKGSVEQFKVSCKVMRDGKAWPDYEMSEFDASGMDDEIDVRNNPRWAKNSVLLQIPFGSTREYQGRKAVPDGIYTVHIDVDGAERDQVKFEVKDGNLTTQGISYPQNLAIADFDLPEEHHGYYLFPLTK